VIRIFAGTFYQAKDLAQRLELKRSDWSYVSRPDVLRGLSGGNVLQYGTVRNRGDYYEVRRMVDDRKMNLLEVPDRGPIPDYVLKAIGRA
jgi:hypothetical protein